MENIHIFVAFLPCLLLISTGPFIKLEKYLTGYIEDITRWHEDVNLPRENDIHIFKLPCNVVFIM